MYDRARLPNVLVIGAMKSGTSSLHRYLDVHPEISMSAEKELHFFSEPTVLARGLDWYARQFVGGTPCRGESSVSYAKNHLYPGTAVRIRGALPGVKLIYLVRDPIQRAVSHYLHSVWKRREPRPIGQALAGPIENKYTLTSRYMTQLDTYLRHFDDRDVLIVELTRLAADPAGCMRQIFRFLGVDPGVTSSAFSKVHNRTHLSRRHPVLCAVADRIPKARSLARCLITARRQPPRHDATACLDPTTFARLADYFLPDIARLERFSGLRFPHWCVADRQPTVETPAALTGLGRLRT